MKREQELLKRIEELEAKVRMLEARQPQHVHHHYPSAPAYPV